MPRYGDGVELDEMLRRLNKLRDALPARTTEEGGEEGDFVARFAALQVLMGEPLPVNPVDRIRHERRIQHEIQAIGMLLTRVHKKAKEDSPERRDAHLASFRLLLAREKTSLRSEQITRTGAGLQGGGGEELTVAQGQALVDIQQRDEEQEQVLEEIARLITQTEELAQSIQGKINEHISLLNDVEQGMESTQTHLETTNTKMKKTLDERGMSCERMCVLCTCIVFILGMIGLIVASL